MPKEEENMRFRSCVIPLTAIIAIASAAEASAQSMVREQKVISSAGARAMVDACAAWAERNHVTLAMSVLDWAGNQIESHAMEGAAANSIDTALLKAKSALRWRRPTSEMNKIVRTGQNLAPTFMKDFPQPGRVADHDRRRCDRRDGGFQRRRRKMRPGRDRRGVQQTKCRRAGSQVIAMK
jgi:hypothetical protein